MSPLDPHHLPESLNLAQAFLHRQLPRHGDRTALWFDGRPLRYRELADEVDRAAAVLRGLGVQPEQRVLLALPDGPDFAIAWFAALKVGAVVAAISPEQKPELFAYYLALTGAPIAVVHASALPSLQSARGRGEALRQVLVAGGDPGAHLSFERERARAAPDARFAATHRDDPAVWLFTSGSSGRPKAAVHKQRDLLYNALTYGLPVLGLSPSDIGLSIPKLAFGYALGTNLLFPLLAGASAVLFPERSTPERIVELIRRHRPTVLTAVPSALAAMLASEAWGRDDLASLRVCISAGEALPPQLYARWKERTGVEILDGIGSAEMFHIFISNRFGEVRPGSLGKLVEGYQAKLCDEQGQEVPHGEMGRLWIRGGSMALEYWRDRELSQRTFRGDFCATQDIFRRDEDGYFWFLGRGDDLLKVKGKWLSPLEVEDALLSHPAVREAAVIGELGADGLQKSKAFVVLNPGAAEGTPLAEALKAHVAAQLAPYKAPRSIQFVPALPKSERGKVLKSSLRG